LPLLLSEHVSGKDEQAMWYGIMAAVFGLMQFFFMPILGALSDKIGRKPVLMISMIGMAVNFFATAWAPTLAALFIGRVIGGACSASMSVASAYASDVSTAENRAKTFGLIGAAFGLGFICGPMLGGFLGEISKTLPFIVGGGICVANAIFGYIFLKESLPLDRRSPFSLKRANPFSSLARLGQRKDIRGLILVYALCAAAQMLQHSTWVLYTNFRFGWGPKENGIALFFVGLTAAVVQAGLLAILIKRFGEVKLSLLGLASGALVAIGYGLATQGWMMYALIVANMLAFAAGPALQGIISKGTDPKEQGALMGSLQSLSSVATIIMPLAGTALLAKVSHYPANDFRVGATFFGCALLQAVAVYVAWQFFKTHPKQTEKIHAT
jgi:MFS transporter, DHA1 family, tetracycline resistance protein